MDKDILFKLTECAQQAQPADIITLVGTPPDKHNAAGSTLVITADYTGGRLIDEAFTRLVIDKVTATAIPWTKPLLFEITYAGNQYRLFWDKLSRRRSALVLGAGHISQPLTEFLAKVGYAVTVVDDRPDFANRTRFPQAEQVVCRQFGRALTELALAGFGAIIIVTRGHRSDMECIRAVITQPAAYIGMIGSQGRVRGAMKTLLEEGFDREAVDRLRAPIGLDIGAETPEEIALSIVAEMVAVDRNANCRPLSDKWRYKHG